MTDSGKLLFLEQTDMNVHPGEVTDLAAHTPATPPVSVADARPVLRELALALAEQGPDPVTQLAAYLISEDPTYLPDGTELRSLVRRIGRDKLLEALLEGYLETVLDTHTIEPQK